MTGRHVAVIGGGLAGLSAALDLRDAGIAVTLLEGRPWLGGATSSFTRADLQVDTGQHVFLRCCTAYRELLARLGMTGSVALQDRFDVTVLAPGRTARLRRSGLPAPLHLAAALSRYPLLSPLERVKVGRAVLAMRSARPEAAALDNMPLGAWLGSRWQPERVRRRLWDLFIVSTLNIAGDAASAALAAKVIRTALLERNDAADIGVPLIPLGQLHGAAAAAALARLGADVRLGAKVTAIEPAAGGGFTVRYAGAALHADGVVLAVPAWIAARLIPAAAATAPRWAALLPSPIVNVHVRYGQRVTRLPFAAAVDSPVQWVFDKTGNAGGGTRDAAGSPGQYLAVSLSGADAYIDKPVAALREQFLPALAELFPAARDAAVTDFFVTRERRATFRQAPGCGGLRPGPATSLPGLVLAGAWTNTGWPDTMEGAVRSGLTAAQQMKRELPGLTAGGPARQPRPAVNAGAPS